MKEYILQYIAQGISIFPCNKDKSPTTINGFYNASCDEYTSSLFNESNLIGIPTGSKNNLIVLDFDINKKIPNTDEIDQRNIEQLIDEVIQNYGPLPDTFQVESMSGGRHLYFLLPENSNINSRTRFINKSLPIDIRGDGGYIIAPDGKNYIVYDDCENLEIKNLKSRCALLPEWILNIQKEKKNEIIEVSKNEILPKSEIIEIRSALSYIPADDRDNWVRIGISLKSTGSASAFGLWNEWSQKSDKYNPNDMEKRWAGFKPRGDLTLASIFHEAQKYGWVTTYDTNNKQQLIEVLSNNTPNIDKIKKEFQKKPFPEELLNPTGLVGDIFHYILDKSIMPQPIFALSASLCAVGALAGRKVQTETGIRTNIYCLNVGGSGSGKEAPRKAIKELFFHAGCPEKACVEDLASDSAIITAMKETESQVFLLDEIGRFLESTRKGATHLYNVVSVLLKMYSAADQVFHGKNYADETKKSLIVQPNLCLLGSTVPDVLYKGLNYESATDGFLSRMLIFETDNNRPRKQRDKNFLLKPGKELIDKIISLNKKPVNMHPNGNLDHFNPCPQVVKMTDNARDILYEFDDYIWNLRNKLENENRIEAMYNRVCQLSEQIALIVATGNNINDPIITEVEISYGICLAKYLADHMQFIVENYMAKNDYEHEVKRILNIIRTSGCISLSEISKKTQNLQGYVRNDVIETLKESKQIKEHLSGNGAHATRMFIAEI